jgi:segregation and condensation protein B
MESNFYLNQQVEAIIFATPQPITIQEITTILQDFLQAEVPSQDIENAIKYLQEKYKQKDYVFDLSKSNGGYQMMTKSEFHPVLSSMLKQQSKKQLSKSSLETLAIIAYKQPVTKSNIEQIRGASADYAVQKLLDRELIEIKGKAETPGNPLLYGTSEKFMEYFGINSLEELPKPQDFGNKENIEEENK